MSTTPVFFVDVLRSPGTRFKNNIESSLRPASVRGRGIALERRGAGRRRNSRVARRGVAARAKIDTGDYVRMHFSAPAVKRTGPVGA